MTFRLWRCLYFTSVFTIYFWRPFIQSLLQDLIMKMDISLTEALTGLKKAVKTLDERTLVIQTVRGEYYANAKLVLNTQIHRRSDQIWRFEDGEGRGYAPVQKPLREREAHHSGVKIYFASIPPWSGLWIDNQWKMWSVFKTEASLCSVQRGFPPCLGAERCRETCIHTAPCVRLLCHSFSISDPFLKSCGQRNVSGMSLSSPMR